MPDAGAGARLTGGHGWRLLAASVTGESHRLRGHGNQDAWRAASALAAGARMGGPAGAATGGIAGRIAGDASDRPGERSDDATETRAAGRPGALLLALADGAGSAPRAAEGAALACDAALAAMQDATGSDSEDAEPGLRNALAAAAAAIDARARQLGVPRNAFACTLLLARLGPERLELLQLGDGVGALRRGGRWERPIPACRGEHVGETVFVSGADPQRDAALRTLPSDGIDAVALLSDGLEALASDLASGAPYAPFFDPLTRFAAAGDGSDDAERAARLSEFLESVRVAARSDDDRTLLLATRIR